MAAPSRSAPSTSASFAASRLPICRCGHGRTAPPPIRVDRRRHLGPRLPQQLLDDARLRVGGKQAEPGALPRLRPRSPDGRIERAVRGGGAAGTVRYGPARSRPEAAPCGMGARPASTSRSPIRPAPRWSSSTGRWRLTSVPRPIPRGDHRHHGERGGDGGDADMAGQAMLSASISWRMARVSPTMRRASRARWAFRGEALEARPPRCTPGAPGRSCRAA